MYDAHLVDVSKCTADLVDPLVYLLMVAIYSSLIEAASRYVLHFYAEVGVLVAVGVMELDDVGMAAETEECCFFDEVVEVG